MKHFRRNSIIIATVTALVLYLVLKDNFKETINLLASSNIWWLLLTIIIYLCFLTIETIVFHRTARTYDKKISFTKILSINMITKFFSGITPLATGGEPMQVVELKKEGMRITDGTNISVQNHIIYQIAIVFWGIIAIISNYSFNLFAEEKVLKGLVIFGFIVHLTMMVLLVFISFNKNFNRAVVKFGVRILSKFKIIKNKDKTIEKLEHSCENFYNGAKQLKNNKTEFLFKVFLRVLSLGFYYSIPYFIVLALGVEHNLTFLITLVSSSYVYLAGSNVPIPGASGGMEYVFLGFFSNYISESPVAATLLVWRFITYFVPTIIGGIVFNIRQEQFNKKIANNIE